MELNLLPIVNCEGKKLPFEVSITLEGFPQKGFRILEPVSVTGEVTNLGGCLELAADCSAKLELICDRCAEAFETNLTYQLNERLRKEDDAEGGDNPDIVTFAGNSIELDQIVYDGLSLSIPTKVLCQDDCKGLCSHCGKNLNYGLCGCKEDTDPRFDVLDKLL